MLKFATDSLCVQAINNYMAHKVHGEPLRFDVLKLLNLDIFDVVNAIIFNCAVHNLFND